MRTLRQFGAAIPVALAIIALVTGLAAVGYTGLTRYGSLKQSVLPTPAELNLLIRRSGVSPEAIAAAGVSAQNTASVVTAGANYIVPNFSAIQDAQLEHANAKTAHAALAKLVQSGLASPAQLIQLDEARTRLTNASNAEQAWLAAIYDECVAGLTSQRSGTLTTLKAGRDWSAPIQYKAAVRSQADWVELRRALANVRIANKLGESPDPAATQTIARADANAAVSAARSGLNNLPLIQIQWDNALNP